MLKFIIGLSCVAGAAFTTGAGATADDGDRCRRRLHAKEHATEFDRVAGIVAPAAVARLEYLMGSAVSEVHPRVRHVTVLGSGYSSIVDLSYRHADVLRRITFDVMVAADGTTLVHDDH